MSKPPSRTRGKSPWANTPTDGVGSGVGNNSLMPRGRGGRRSGYDAKAGNTACVATEHAAGKERDGLVSLSS